jgi:hypothetical protein
VQFLRCRRDVETALGDGGEVAQLVQLHWPKPNPTGTFLLPVYNRRAALQKQSFVQ